MKKHLLILFKGMPFVIAILLLLVLAVYQPEYLIMLLLLGLSYVFGMLFEV
jgi:hypothetical protein